MNIPFSPAAIPPAPDLLASVPVHVSLLFDFSDWQATHPTQPLPGTSIDAEYTQGYDALNNVMDRLALIQRDDGGLMNEIVKLDSLDPEVMQALEDLVQQSNDSAANAAAAAASAAAAQSSATASANSAQASEDAATTGATNANNAAAAAAGSATAAQNSANAAAASAAIMPPLPNTADSVLTTNAAGTAYLLRTSILMDPNDGKFDALNKWIKNVPAPANDTDVMRRIDVKDNTPYLNGAGRFDAGGHPIINAGAPIGLNDLARMIDVNNAVSGAGSVPPPIAGDENHVLTATAPGVFGWVAFLTDMIADATAFVRNIMKTVNDAAGFRAAIGAASDAATTAALAGKQDLDAMLTALAGLVSANNKGLMFTGVDAVATYDLSAFARTFLDDADAATVRGTLGAAAATQAVPVPANPGDNAKVLTANAGAFAWTAPAAPAQATEAVIGGLRIVDTATLAAGADDLEAVTAAKLAASKYNPVGKQSFLIPASSLIPHPSAGPSLVTVATANGQIYRALRFADAVSTLAGLPIPLPKKVDVAQNLSLRLRYTASVGGNVRWNFGVRAVSDGDAIDAAATAVSLTSTITANTQETTAETVIGIPTGIAKEDTAFLYVQRLGADGADALAGNADLISVELICSVDKGTDA